MKIGEIKLSSLNLTVPSLEISFDSDSDDSIRDTIMNLKENPNVSDYIPMLSHAINRAISIIEKRGAGKTKRIMVESKILEKTRNGYRIDLDQIGSDILYVNEILLNGRECSFERENERAVLLYSNGMGEYEIFYKSKIARITEATSDTYELEIDHALAELIPYFVKSELIFSEEPEQSERAKKYFFELIGEFLCKEKDNSVNFETVFLLE